MTAVCVTVQRENKDAEFLNAKVAEVWLHLTLSESFICVNSTAAKNNTNKHQLQCGI